MSAATAQLNVARWLPRSRVNGPGERFVLWVQGCPLHCPGCWNPDTWSFAPRKVVSVAELLEHVLAVRPIDGVTFTGGEPFAQAGPLADLAESLRGHDLSLMAFTGYELHELTHPDQQRLLAQLDIVVTGRFVRELQADGLLWRGSSNQRVHYLTPRHARREVEVGGEPTAELIIDRSGRVSVVGFPIQELLVELGLPSRIATRHGERSV
ncbi:MAG: 4Fe-4S single cluster domain-containing protein [Tepidisphaerales bacterium]